MSDIKKEVEQEVEKFLENLKLFNDRVDDDCLVCGKKVTQLVKRGRCVYAQPCGCRLWQGQIPGAWVKK